MVGHGRLGGKENEKERERGKGKRKEKIEGKSLGLGLLLSPKPTLEWLCIGLKWPDLRGI